MICDQASQLGLRINAGGDSHYMVQVDQSYGFRALNILMLTIDLLDPILYSGVDSHFLGSFLNTDSLATGYSRRRIDA